MAPALQRTFGARRICPVASSVKGVTPSIVIFLSPETIVQNDDCSEVTPFSPESPTRHCHFVKTGFSNRGYSHSTSAGGAWPALLKLRRCSAPSKAPAKESQAPRFSKGWEFMAF